MNEPPRRQISSWQDAELNARDWMIARGYTDAAVSGPGADGGIDVAARGALAQVKFEATQVGRPHLQRLVGARARDDVKLLFFTGAGYSQKAIEYAAHMDIALFHYSLDGRMTPVNQPAKEAARRPAVPGSAASGCGCLMFLVGALLLVGFINGIVNGIQVPPNQSLESVLGGSFILCASLLGVIGGILLMRRGAKQSKESAGEPYPADQAEQEE